MAGSFTLDLDRFVRHANANIDDLVAGVVLELGRKVVERSPVGDALYWQSPPPAGYVGGRFRANWQHGVGIMPLSTFDGTENTSVSRILGSIPRQASGKLHYIVNNLPYSLRLENGWSRQAPQGIVGRALLEFPGIVAREARRIR